MFSNLAATRFRYFTVLINSPIPEYFIELYDPLHLQAHIIYLFNKQYLDSIACLNFPGLQTTTSTLLFH